MAAKERTPTELARFFFILTLFGIVAWMALAWAMMASPNDPLAVQTHDYETSVWRAQQDALRQQPPTRVINPEHLKLAQR